MYEGVITSLNLSRGFGFLKSPNHPREVFFNAADLEGGLQFAETLQERRVRFNVITTPKGPKAVRINPVK